MKKLLKTKKEILFTSKHNGKRTVLNVDKKEINENKIPILNIDIEDDKDHCIEKTSLQKLKENVMLTKELIENYSTVITKIDGKPFEGVVIKYKNGSFKIINKHYDMIK